LELLEANEYVHLIALDFSKAFDTVRHSYLAEQLAEMQIPDCIYNWIVAFLEDRGHGTKFNGFTSPLMKINSSFVQGSGSGPNNFIITISKLKTIHIGNIILKYADDSYLLIPSSNSATVSAELEHVTNWAKACNLKLNHKKTQEMIVRGVGRRGRVSAPAATPGVTRVHSMKVLGVMLTETLSFEMHIAQICCRARQSMYALRILTAHGLSGPGLYDVVRATTVARLLYAAPAWWGFASQREKGMLQSVMNRLIRQRYLPSDSPTFEQLCLKADTCLFSAVLANPGHVLHRFLPPKKLLAYSLRPRSHDRVLPLANHTMKKLL